MRVAVSTAVLATTAFAMPAASDNRPESESPHQYAEVSGWTQDGQASWYGSRYHGRLTASGETFDMGSMTAAHRSLPFGTWLEVENLSNGKTVRVRVNDRGPFAKNRVIDLARAAADQLEFVSSGAVRVRLTVMPAPDDRLDESPQVQPEPAAESDSGKAHTLRAHATSMPTAARPFLLREGCDQWSGGGALSLPKGSGPAARPAYGTAVLGSGLGAILSGLNTLDSDSAVPTVLFARPVRSSAVGLPDSSHGTEWAALGPPKCPATPPPQWAGYSTAGDPDYRVQELFARSRSAACEGPHGFL